MFLIPPHRYSNEDVIVIISCSLCLLHADPLSAIELLSLMNLSGDSDSGCGVLSTKLDDLFGWCVETVWVWVWAWGHITAKRDGGLSCATRDWFNHMLLNVHLIWITGCLLRVASPPLPSLHSNPTPLKRESLNTQEDAPAVIMVN